MMPNKEPVKCFISYSWDSEEHKDWVRDLANELVNKGVSVALDQWDLEPGDDLAEYMETNVRESDYVLLVCTPAFKKKADLRRGGVGYETQVVTGEAFRSIAEKGKFVPLVRDGEPAQSIPSYLTAAVHVDLREGVDSRPAMEELLRKLHRTPKYTRPPRGANPFAAERIRGMSSTRDESESVPLQPHKAVLQGQIPESDRFEIQMYWGYRPAAHEDLRQSILACSTELFIAGMGLTTIADVLNDPQVTGAIAKNIGSNPRFKATIVTGADANHIRGHEQGGQELEDKLKRGHAALCRFYQNLDALVPENIVRPLIDFLTYDENIVPRHFILQADDAIYVGSYLCHQQGSYSYLLKLRNFGEGLYSLFAKEIAHVKANSHAYQLDT